MLYQLSYTPRPPREVATRSVRRKSGTEQIREVDPFALRQTSLGCYLTWTTTFPFERPVST